MSKLKTYGPGIDHEYGSQPIARGGSGARTPEKAAENLGTLSGELIDGSNGIGLLDEEGFVQEKHYPAELGAYEIPTITGPSSVVAGEESLFYISNYDSSVNYVASATNGVVVLNGDVLRVTPDASAVSVVITVNGKSITVPAVSVSPEVPTVIYPIQNQAVDLINPIMLASDFQEGATNEPQTGQEWQLSENNTFSPVLLSYSAASGQEWPMDPAPLGKPLFLRTRHSSASGASAWSPVLRYVASAISVKKPTITLSAIPGVANGMRITSSKFNMMTYRRGNQVTVDESLATGVILYGSSVGIELQVKASEANPVQVVAEGQTHNYVADANVRLLLGNAAYASISFTKSGNASSEIKYRLLNTSASHLETSWEVANDINFTSIVAAYSADTVNKITRDITNLVHGQRYYARAKHRIEGASSDWSATAAMTISSSVTQPTISAPISGSINVPPTFTITASAFSALPSTLQHTSSDWEVSENVDFTAIVASSYNNTTAKTSYAPPNMQYGKRLYARVRYKSGAIVSDWSPVINLTTTSYIEQPVVTAPANDAIGVATTLTVISSAYEAFPNTLAHTSSDWQLSEQADFSTIAREVTASTTFKSSWTLDGLNFRKAYYLRVRHRSGSVVSAWSPSIKFTTMTSIQIPVITAPVANTLDAETTLTLRSAAFVSTPSTVMHEASDWQLALDSGFNNVIQSTNNDQINRTSWVVTDLEYGKVYYARVRHLADGSASAWSATRTFSTRVNITQPALAAPQNNEVDVNIQTMLTLTAFTADPVSSPHSSTDWQIATDTAFTSIARENPASTTALTSWQVTLPEHGKIYYARARYRSGQFVSAWSPTVKFTSIVTIAKPTLVAPVNNQDAVPLTFSAVSSPFSVLPANTVHAASDWQLSLQQDFSTIFREALNSVANKTTWSMTALPKGTDFYLRVRHRTALKAGEWSDGIKFTTAVTMGAVDLSELLDKIVYNPALVLETTQEPSDAETVAVGIAAAPWVETYRWDKTTGFGTKTSRPNAAPFGEVNGVGFGLKFSPDNRYLAAAQEQPPYLSTTYWDAESPFSPEVKAVAAPLISGAAMDVDWSPSGNAIAVAHANSPFVSAYRFIEEVVDNVPTGVKFFGNKYANPATLPPAVGYDVAFSPSGAALAVTHPNAPCVTVYRWTDASGFGLKYNNPSVQPVAYGNGVAFSPTGSVIAVLQNTAPFIHCYQWSDASGFGTKYANPASYVAGNAAEVAFSPDGNAIVIAHANSPCVSVYEWSDETGFGARYSNPTSLIAGTANSATFTPDGEAIIVTHTSAPYVSAYEWNNQTGFGDKYPNPANALTAAAYGLAFSTAAKQPALNAGGLTVTGAYLDSDPVEGVPLISDWEITPVSTAGVDLTPFVINSTVFNHGNNTLSFNAVDFPTIGRSYKVRARTKRGGNVGAYSPQVAFKMPVLSSDPVITAPANNLTGVSRTPTFTVAVPTTIPNDINKAEIVRYQWTVHAVTNLSTPVYTSGIVKGTSFTMPEQLLGLTEYQVSVRVCIVDDQGLSYRTKKIASNRFTTKQARVLELSFTHEGKTEWDLDSDGPLILDGLSTGVSNPAYRKMTPKYGDMSVQLKAWGGAGASTRDYGGYGGPGGHAKGTILLREETYYTALVSNIAGRQDTGYTFPGGGYLGNDHTSGGGGGFTGLFLGDITELTFANKATVKNAALLIAGGGGGSGMPAGYGSFGVNSTIAVGGAGGSTGDGNNVLNGAPRPNGNVIGNAVTTGGTATAGGIGRQPGYALFGGIAHIASGTIEGGGFIDPETGGGGNTTYNGYGGGGGGGFFGGGSGNFTTDKLGGQAASPITVFTGGGGGSSYINPTYITAGSLVAGYVSIAYYTATGLFAGVDAIRPGAHTDVHRGNAGSQGYPGRLVII